MRSGTRQLNVQDTHKTQGIQVISRAADILRVLGENAGGQSLGQIARKVELPRSTVQRIVSALIHEGFVATDGGNGGIRLGDQIRVLANAPAFDLRGHFRPLLEQIAAATSETVDLAVLEGPHMRFIDQIEGSQRLRTVSTIGDKFPLTTTANGKAALAQLSDASARTLIAKELGGFAVVGPNKEIAAISVPVPSSRFHRIKADLGEKLHKIRRNAFFSD